MNGSSQDPRTSILACGSEVGGLDKGRIGAIYGVEKISKARHNADREGESHIVRRANITHKKVLLAALTQTGSSLVGSSAVPLGGGPASYC